MELGVGVPAVAILAVPDAAKLMANPKMDREVEQRVIGQSVSIQIICLKAPKTQPRSQV